MAEEVKKKAKPRTTKKAGAGTQLTVEKQEIQQAESALESGVETAGLTAAKTAKAPKKAVAEKAVKAAKQPVEQRAEQSAEQPVGKTPARRTRKKAEPAEAPAEIVAETSVKAEEPKKRGRKKKAEEPILAVEEVAKMQPSVEAAVETVQGQTEQTAEKTAEKTAKKPAKKAEKTAKKGQKTGEKLDKKPQQDTPETKPEEKAPALTKAEKKEVVKKLTRELLQTECKWAELVDRVAQGYKDAYPTPENANLNDVKGRVGSVLHVMQEEGEIVLDGNLVKLAEKRAKTEKEATVSATKEEIRVASPAEKQPVKQTQTDETPSATSVAKVEAETPAPVYDLSALFSTGKSAKKSAEKPKKTVDDLAQEKTEELAKTKPVEKPEKLEKAELAADSLPIKAADEKPAQKQEKKGAEKPQAHTAAKKEVPTRRAGRSAKSDPLKEAFLKRLRSLGGNYFEYYSIYLLERYSRMNGRRLEGLRISGGEYDGGIDGELELTDRLGFRETIYVQAKNWEPTDERWWIGETILQQFIGAVTYRQAKEGKQHCRGMFITTSAFTTGAKEMLDKLSDKFVGYDGDELFETAKERYLKRR